MTFTMTNMTLLEVKYHTGCDSYSYYIWNDSFYDIYSYSEEANKSLVPVGDKVYLNFYQV